MVESKFKLYCVWFCLFVYRVWILMLVKGVDFEYIEQDFYNKFVGWLVVNLRGLIFVIVYNGKLVYESYVCIEYIDEVWLGE